MLHRRKVRRYVCTETEPVVATKYGRLRGFKADDVYVFRGIPYAKAERFGMPTTPDPWEGIRDAQVYGSGSPDMSISLMGGTDFDQPMVPGRFWAMSEDCQNLNIWTRSTDPAAKRPVMVWMHGGGFAAGSATHLYSYDGYEMADNYDVVIVTVNHRLNMAGFLDLSDFGLEHSGNAGMADLVAALEWVRDNIENFGGDPGNVTIYGQSGGGGKVTTLMQMPSADGLYHRAIIQSGVMRGSMGNPTLVKEVAAKTVGILGLNSSNIEKIRELDYTVVADAVKQATPDSLGGMGLWAPVPEEGYFIGSPLDVGFRPETKNIPIMVGSCLAEFAMNMPTGDKSRWSDEQRMTVLARAFGDGADEVKRLFEKAYPEIDVSYAASVDIFCRPALLDFIDRRKAEADAAVYNYVFTFESPFMGGQLTGHNGDLHFMFRNASYMEAMCKPGITERLEDEMGGAWAQFALAGNPNREGLPRWDAYTTENGACLALGDTTVMKYAHDRELLAAVQRYTAR